MGIDLCAYSCVRDLLCSWIQSFDQAQSLLPKGTIPETTARMFPQDSLSKSLCNKVYKITDLTSAHYIVPRIFREDVCSD